MTKVEEVYSKYKDIYKKDVIMKNENGVMFMVMNLMPTETSVICTYVNVEGSQSIRHDPISSVVKNFEIVPQGEL
jgi:hypothetical protein